MVRLRERRHTLKWIVGGIVAILALFAIFAVAVGFGRATVAPSAPRSAEKPVATTPAPTTPPAAKVAPAPPEAKPAAAPTVTVTAPEVPVFDVNSLKSAPAPAKPRR